MTKPFFADKISLPAWTAWLLVLLPALYYVAFSQSGALVHPFWDHAGDTSSLVASAHDGALTLSRIFQPHNEHRIAAPRLLLLGPALLSGWNLRWEFVLLNLFQTGQVAAVLFFLHRVLPANVGGWERTAILGAAAILGFSPAQHVNMWWSFMIELVMCCAYVLCAYVLLAQAARRWPSRILAAILLWFATYSFASGILAFLPVLLLVLFLRKTTWMERAFWIANATAAAALYFPGLPFTAQEHPGVIDLALYVLVFLGKPLGNLVWMYHIGMFGHASEYAINAVCGGVVCALAAAYFIHVLRKRERLAETRNGFFVLAVSYAVLVAGAVGYGRGALPGYGVAHAGVSPTTIVANIMYFGLLAACCDLQRALPFLTRLKGGFAARAGWAAAVLLLALSCTTYARAWAIVDEAQGLNRSLSKAYAVHDKSVPEDSSLYPSASEALAIKQRLHERRLGPYRGGGNDFH